MTGDSRDSFARYREELDAMAVKSRLPRKLKTLRKDLAAAQTEPAETAVAGGKA